MTDATQKWTLRALSLVIALGLWWMLSLESRQELAERNFEVAVSYIKPRDLLILNPVEKANVRISGTPENLRNLSQFMIDLQVEIPLNRTGAVSLALDADNVRLPAGEDLEVVSIDPRVLTLQLDTEVQRRLPLRHHLVGEPAAGARVLEEKVSLEPTEAVVSGPASRLNDLEHLDLAPVNLNGHAFTFEETAAVISPDPLVKIVENPRARVTIPMDLGRPNGGDSSGQSGGGPGL